MAINSGIRDGWMCEREMPQAAIQPGWRGKPSMSQYEEDYLEGVRLGRAYPEFTLEQALKEDKNAKR